MERLGKARHGREGRRLSEREVSESSLATEPYVRFAGSLDFARKQAGTPRCGIRDTTVISAQDRYRRLVTGGL